MSVAVLTEFRRHWRNASLLYLAFTWCLGLSYGMYFALRAEFVSYSMMHSLLSSPVSIVSLLVAGIVPLIVSVIFIRFRLSVFILPVAFSKSFLISFCQCCLLTSFGSAGWLVKAVIMFSGSINSALLLFYWSLYINQTGQWHIRSFLILTFAVISVCFVDYCFISSYFAAMIM